MTSGDATVMTKMLHDVDALRDTSQKFEEYLGSVKEAQTSHTMNLKRRERNTIVPHVSIGATVYGPY